MVPEYGLEREGDRLCHVLFAKNKGTKRDVLRAPCKFVGFFSLWLPLSPSYIVRAEKCSTHTAFPRGSEWP